MGLFVILMVVLLEIVGMGFSYWFGAHAFGIGTTWAPMINGLVAAYPGMARYLRF